MSDFSNKTGRKSLAHFPPLEFPNQSVILFVTCNILKRRLLLTRPEIHRTLLKAWQKADHWLIGRYVLMPDHLHFFCAPRHLPLTPLKKWMEFWRADATRLWPFPTEKPVWQKDFFDRQLRRGESYSEKWLYELRNPVVAGLVNRWEDWPYQGELNVLQWHERA